MRGSIRRDDEAVSPVIATVLLLAITVMLSSMVFVMMQGALTTVEKTAPQATVSVRALDNGFHVVRITSLDQSIDPARLQYTLQPADTNQSLLIRGDVADTDVYGVIGTNISFHDRDAGYSVTQGDYFVIDSATIGADDGTWRFKLVEQASSSLIVDVSLPAMS
ncbi:MAG TPA: type IV pilin [Candidatus Poseidoniales archaeon]|nr:MAG TPA: type IV pilin [Candidatus Poseidoniales archaeon]|tara:strand:+ start:1018 stop:1509 length:492 start_codon:yes stop_codon:yes gene_type:complete